MDRIIRWGIIGAGNIAGRFAKSLQHQKDSVLYAISGRNPEKLELFARKYPCEKQYLSYEELIEDPDIDAIYVSLPNEFHFKYSVLALENKKAVLCEKPATVNVEQMKQVAEASRKNHTLFMEAMKTRFTPAYRELKEEIENGIIGAVKMIDTRICFTLPEGGNSKGKHYLDPDNGGVLRDSGIYCASWFEDFFEGVPVIDDVKVQMKGGCDFHVISSFSYDGKKGKMEVSYERDKEPDAYLYGEKGYISVNHLHRMSEYSVFEDGKDERTVVIPYEHDDFYGQINHFVNLLKEGKMESDIMSLNDSITCARLLEMIRENFTEYDEEDLKILERQEEDLEYESFDHHDALKLANQVLELIKDYDRNVSIMITDETEQYNIYQYFMEGKTKANMYYMEGKRQVSLLCNHSSAWAVIRNKISKDFGEETKDAKYIFSGGAFPIRVKGKRVATLCVSGLHEGYDHEVMVRALEKALNRRTLTFHKALY